MKYYDPLFNINSELIINHDDPTQSGVKYSADSQDLMDANAALRNAEVGQFNKFTGNDGKNHLVARFDANSIMYFKLKYNLDFFKTEDRDKILKLVDIDPSYRGFKTTNAKIM